jgi:CheY-like chemotaxis protein
MVQKKILVVDDEDFILDMVSEILRERGYWVVTAKHSGLAAIQATDVDLIVLDMNLGEKDDPGGGKLLGRLRENTFRTVPVIVYSGLLNSEKVKDNLETITSVEGKGGNIYRCVEKGQGVLKLIYAVDSYFAAAPHRAA